MEYTNERNEKVICYCDECLMKKILDASLCSAWTSDEFISNLKKIKDDLNKLSADFKKELNK